MLLSYLPTWFFTDPLFGSMNFLTCIRSGHNDELNNLLNWLTGTVSLNELNLASGLATHSRARTMKPALTMSCCRTSTTVCLSTLYI